MARVREWMIRLWGTLRRRRRDSDLEQELRLHMELALEDARRGGASREGAARVAALRAGGITQALEALRDQRGLPWLEDLLRDVRHAARLLRRSPVFAGVAVISLALGIGANTAMFSLADELILRPLPVRDPRGIMTLSADAPDDGWFAGSGMSYPNFRDLRSVSRSFDGLFAYRMSSVSFARSRRAVREVRMGMLVSDNFFTVLGVQPVVGRGFTREEGRVPGRDAVVVLSYDFWKNSLGGDGSIPGGIVWMNGIAFHVIGVAPASFTGIEPPLRPAFYVPIVMAQRLGAAPQDPLEDRQARSVGAMGRLKRGVSQQSAQAEMTTLWRALARQYPRANRNRTIVVRSQLEERIRSDPWDLVIITLLTALAAIVLFIACANVANLMLGRARSRSREIAIRLALGVSRPRLLRQLLTETGLLALIGWIVGLAIAYGGIAFLRTIPPAGAQVVIAPRLDERVLLFALLVAAVSAVLCGLAPARQSLRAQLVPALKTSDAETTRRKTTGRNVLVAAQVALSMVLLIATGMLLDGFRKALVLDPGFRTDHVLMMSLNTSLARYTTRQTRVFYRDLVDRARQLPGVVAVGLASVVPFQIGGQETEAVIPEGYQFPQGQEHASTFTAVVDEDYFRAMRIEVTRGRRFTAADKEGSRGVAVVNEEFAKTYWPNQDPIGKRISLTDQRGPWLEVVGETKTAKYTWIAERPTPFLYLPFAQIDRKRMSLFVETAPDDPSRLAAPLRDIVRTLDIDQPVLNVQPFSRLYQERTIAVPLMITQMVGTMGLLGLTLALIGLYGLVAYSVARRTREIGIRMAMGATRPDVLRMVLGQGLRLSIAGIIVGGAASVVAARLLIAALAGLGTPSPSTYVIVPLALVCLTIAASYVPARRASMVDPLVALRDE